MQFEHIHPDHRIALARQLVAVAKTLAHRPYSLPGMVALHQDLTDIVEALVPYIPNDVKPFSPDEISSIPIERERRSKPIHLASLNLIDNTEEQSYEIGAYNIVQLYKTATPEEVLFWKGFYKTAYKDVAAIANKYSSTPGGRKKLPYSLVAAVVALLSPNTKWRDNLISAEAAIRLASSFIKEQRRVDFESELEKASKELADSVKRRKYLVNLLQFLDKYHPLSSSEEGISPETDVSYVDPSWRMDKESPEEKINTLKNMEEALTRQIQKTGFSQRDELLNKRNQLRRYMANEELKYIDSRTPVLKEKVRKYDKAYMENIKLHVEDTQESGTFKSLQSYPKNIRKAINLIESEDIGAWLVGPKVNSFYQALMDPDGIQAEARDVVIDGHGIHLWLGTKGRNLKQVPQVRPAKSPRRLTRRKKILLSYEVAAEKIKDITKDELQSVTWYLWRNVVDRPKGTPKSVLQENLLTEKPSVETVKEDYSSQRYRDEYGDVPF